MLISELEQNNGSEQAQSTIDDLEKLIGFVEKDCSCSEEFLKRLSASVAGIPSTLNENQVTGLWKLSYRLWNVCVDMANNTLGTEKEMDVLQVKLRQVACDILLEAGESQSVRSGKLKMAMFLSRTGSMWHKIKEFEQAEACFSKATEICAQIASKDDITSREDSEILELKFEIYTSRSRASWELGQHALASNLLGRASTLVKRLPKKAYILAEQYLTFGRLTMSKNDDQDAASDAIPLLEQAYEISSTFSQSISQTENLSDELSSLKQRVLRYLAGAHVQTHNYEAALKCVATLKLQSSHPSVPFLELRALLGIERTQDAIEVMKNLLEEEGCTAELAAAGLESILSAKNEALSSSISEIVEIMMQKFPSHPKLTILIIENLLTRPKKELIDIGLSIAKKSQTKEVLQGKTMSDDQHDREYVYAIMWNAASQKFHMKEFSISKELFETSLMYLQEDSKDQARRAKVMRVLTLCHLGTEDLNQAEDCVNLAERLESCIASSFLKFKVLIQKGDVEMGAKQVTEMVRCKDFEPEYLALACHEAVTSGSTDAAIAALSVLLKFHSDNTPTPTKEAVLLRNMISLKVKSGVKESETLTFFQRAQTRLCELGAQEFLGEGEEADNEALWFAGTAWNYGLNAGNCGEWESSMRFFPCAADFYGVVRGNSEAKQCQKKAFLMAAAAVLAENSASEENLKIADFCLEKCKKISGHGSEVLDEAGHLQYLLLLFEVKNRMKDFDTMAEVVNQCKSMQGMSADHFLRLAFDCGDETEKAREISSSILKTCLLRILSLAKPDYSTVALVIRKLIQLADASDKDGEEVLAFYSESAKLLVGLDPNTYPRDELQWLVATAWNRAPFLIKFKRLEEAEKWMKVAIELQTRLTGVQNQSKMMMDAYSKLQEKKCESSEMEQ